MIFFVKISIIYFSPKNKDEYIKIFLIKTSIDFFKKKSKKNPDFKTLRKFFFLLVIFNK